MKNHLRNAPPSFIGPTACRALAVALSCLMLLICQPLAAQPLPEQQVLPAETAGQVERPGADSPQTIADRMETQRTACFDRIWSNYQEDVWFYGDNGKRILPTMDLTWLVVRLNDRNTSEAGMAVAAPPSFEAFNARYGAYFSHFLHDPALAPAMAAYKLRRDMPKDVFKTLMTRLHQDPQVLYAHPAWNIEDQLHAPLERIDITWKTATDLGQRHALLQALGAVPTDEAVTANRQQISIDPCRRSVWQAANLLADDIRVAQARPLLMPLVPPIGVRFDLGLNGATPGSAIPFTFEIRFTDRIKIESSTIANLNLKPAGIFHNLYDIHYDVPLSSIDLNRSPIRITGQLKIYATGEFSIPGIPVYYTDSGAPGSKVQRTKTDEMPVRIAAMIPERHSGFELQVVPPEPLPGIDPAEASKAKRHAVLLLLAGLLLIGLVATVAALLRRNRRLAAQKPENHALARCHAAVQSAVIAAQQHPGLSEYVALGTVWKHYLAEFADLDPDKRGGSHASFYRRIEAELPMECRQSIAELLAGFDQILARGADAPLPKDLPDRTALLLGALQAFAQPQPEYAQKD
ncbi:hypothetical protein Pcar_0460 [Syntrophotalea carbinolica DSM 2380]|uniref:Protein BatD n=1 Tax=Syntrophotalea carbinolica (strain DSM 2380 / NBRC 103641 / GraBd1) TaxID=338963 RepID=Q3A7C4_SYNC1|nr:hypothetical protein [Syntrophotalea carbinolica]ABA87720.1 hypothetical protein Pcar_0460 [Syntrophotalea carbinolica DSM 2380]